MQLLKGFVGTGILFMAKAFFNGGTSAHMILPRSDVCCDEMVADR